MGARRGIADRMVTSPVVGRKLPHMLDASLRGTRLKISRASEHLQCLAKVFDDDCKASNYSFDPQVVDGGSKHLYRAKGSIPVNDQWSAFVGDCAHNLRSALDHLACQLVIANGHSPTSRTSFPILHSSPSTTDCFQFPQWAKRPRRRIPTDFNIAGGVDPVALRMIEEVQPYKQSETGELLGVLGDLDNTDKHRELVVVASAIHAAQTHYESTPVVANFGESINMQINPPSIRFTGAHIRDGALVAVVGYDPPRTDPDEHLKFETFLRLSKDSPGAERLVLPLLARLIYLIEDELLSQFQAFFP
jgi:hypothetical protein